MVSFLWIPEYKVSVASLTLSIICGLNVCSIEQQKAGEENSRIKQRILEKQKNEIIDILRK